jgi:hypothetical protein
MDSDRRSCTEGRARFSLYKAHVAATLSTVEPLMPKPWFEDLVCQMARVRIRCEHGITGEHPVPAPMPDPAPEPPQAIGS